MPPPDDDMLTELRTRLRADLKTAMKSRSAVEVSAIRSLLAALDDAEAVAPPATAPISSLGGEHVAGAAVGVGSTEVDRRVLTAAEVELVVSGQIEERQAAAATFDAVAQPDAARRLRDEAGVIERYRLDNRPGPGRIEA